MERRNFLIALAGFGGAALAASAIPAAALPALATPPVADTAAAAPAVATAQDLAGAKIDNVYWVRRRYYYRPRFYGRCRLFRGPDGRLFRRCF